MVAPSFNEPTLGCNNWGLGLGALRDGLELIRVVAVLLFKLFSNHLDIPGEVAEESAGARNAEVVCHWAGPYAPRRLGVVKRNLLSRK